MGVFAVADHAVVSRNFSVKIEADIDPVQTPLFGCAVLAGASVAVVGLGGVGLCALLGALAAGARKGIAVDLHENKLELATSLSATAAANAHDSDMMVTVMELSKGGVDYALEMPGSVQAMEAAYRMTRCGGMTETAGPPHPHRRWLLQQVHLVAEERMVKGSYIRSCVPLRDVPRYIGLYLAGKLPVNLD